MRKYYIAGPMRGYPEFNFPEFHKAARILRRVGCEVFNPAERDEAEGFDPTGLQGTMDELKKLKFDLREALKVDLGWICDHATHLYMLRGWSDSSGARAEYALGKALGLTIEGEAS